MREHLLLSLSNAIAAAPEREQMELEEAMNAYLQAFPRTLTAGVPLVVSLFQAVEQGLGYEGFACALEA